MNMNSKYKFHWKPSPFQNDNGSNKEFSKAAKFLSNVNEKVFSAFVYFILLVVGFVEVFSVFGTTMETSLREFFKHNEIFVLGLSFAIIALLFFTANTIFSYSEKLQEESKKYKNSHI